MELEITQFSCLERKQYFAFQPENSGKKEYPGKDTQSSVASTKEKLGIKNINLELFQRI